MSIRQMQKINKLILASNWKSRPAVLRTNVLSTWNYSRVFSGHTCEVQQTGRRHYGGYRERLLDGLRQLEEESAGGFTAVDSTPSRSLHHGREFEPNAVEDQLFDLLSEDKQRVSLKRFVSDLRKSGLRLTDPRLLKCMNSLKHLKRMAAEMESPETHLDKDTFRTCIRDNLVLIKRAFMSDFVIPEFGKFSQHIDALYRDCKTNCDGTVASYIPQLSRYSADYWGVSVCTIDAQRHSLGDVDVPFCLQSCSKPLVYSLALDDLGCQSFHEFVGQEPSGVSFNAIALDRNNKPHNPMINPGAIVTASLLKNNLRHADRFDYVQQQFKRMAGGEFIGFNNSVFLSERETADRNFALGYYLKENKCFPNGVNLIETLDFYFQMCSVEVTCESASVIAATLANGGICPLTGEQVLSADAIRNTLSLMYSCGMYDYSGEFAFTVGLPAKSGVSGAVLLVVPNVMGVCLWSPPLDACGNSERGLQFCKSLVSKFNFHQFDNLQYTRRKDDPRRSSVERRESEVTSLLFGAFKGDIGALDRMYLSGVKMDRADYDGRTALHLASAEGHVGCVKFLLDTCRVTADPRDRWDRTPHDDAVRYGHQAITRLIEHALTHGATESQSTASNHDESDSPLEQTNQDCFNSHVDQSQPAEENDDVTDRFKTEQELSPKK